MIVTILRTSDEGSGAADRGAGSSTTSKPGNAADARPPVRLGGAGCAPMVDHAGVGGAEYGAGGAGAGGVEGAPPYPPPSSTASSIGAVCWSTPVARGSTPGSASAGPPGVAGSADAHPSAAPPAGEAGSDDGVPSGGGLTSWVTGCWWRPGGAHGS